MCIGVRSRSARCSRTRYRNPRAHFFCLFPQRSKPPTQFACSTLPQQCTAKRFPPFSPAYPPFYQMESALSFLLYFSCSAPLHHRANIMRRRVCLPACLSVCLSVCLSACVREVCALWQGTHHTSAAANAKTAPHFCFLFLFFLPSFYLISILFYSLL